MEQLNIPELVANLGSSDDPRRKMAAFKLQNAIADPSFADVFITEGGLPKLQSLTINSSGNTLAYSLASMANLLDLDRGWNEISPQLIERLVQLVVGQPLVNILRGAMSILTNIVSHPRDSGPNPDSFGMRALSPAVLKYPQFLEMLVSRLSSADHSLCANALQLINALIKDAVTHDPDTEWPKFMKRLQDLGVIKAVYLLMQSTGLQDLAHALLDFQGLMKVMLRKWKDAPVDAARAEHRRALLAIHRASLGLDYQGNLEKESISWQRLGFDTETPANEFEEVGYLGMMDLMDYIRKSQDGFHRLLLEESGKPDDERFPAAKASLAVTSILYDHFEVGRTDLDEQQRYISTESRSNMDKVFKPLLLQWSRLHESGIQAFLRLWAATGAKVEDYDKIEELVRILIEHVVGLAPRTRDVHEVEEDLGRFELQKLRDLQIELLELTHEDVWGHHLRQIKDDLHHEALQFIKEQRIRCLLQGAWFPNLGQQPSSPTLGKRSAIEALAALPQTVPSPSSSQPWRFARLSHNRRYLHYADFDRKPPPTSNAPSNQGETESSPDLESLENKIDLSSVTSVVSNVVPSPTQPDTQATLNRAPASPTPPATLTTITIHGAPSPSQSSSGAGVNSPVPHRRNQSSMSRTSPAPGSPTKLTSGNDNNTASTGADAGDEIPLLTLHAPTTPLASEWLDGLLMLLSQAPITSETGRLIEFVERYGIRIRLLNVRFEDDDGERNELNVGVRGGARRDVEVPSREGVDEEFFYEIAAA